MFKLFAKKFKTFVCLMCKGFLMLCFSVHRSIGIFFLFCIATMFCFIRDLQSFFLHILYIPLTFIWLILLLVVFFVALTQSIVMVFFASRLVPSYFTIIFISQVFLLTSSYIVLCNYFYITIYYVYGWFYLALQLLLYHNLSCL